jgi:acylphosphatase
MQRVRVDVRGNVQGVGFRMFVVRHARALGLAGWVRNREDGSVEVEAEGTRESLERLVSDLEAGPVGARVAQVDARWGEGPARHHGFEIAR